MDTTATRGGIGAVGGEGTRALASRPARASRHSDVRSTFRRIACLGGIELLCAQAGVKPAARGGLAGGAFPVHSHDEYTIVRIEAGRSAFLAGDRVWRGEAGALVVIGPGVPHGGGATDGVPVRYRSIVVPKAVMGGAGAAWAGGDAGALALPTFHRPIVQDPALSAAFGGLHERLMASPDPKHECDALRALLRDLVLKHATPEAGESAREPRRIRVVREHLAQNLTESASLDRLSDLVGVSPFYLQRTFKAATRMSPREYLTDLRIKRARELLREGVTPRVVAGRVGFFDQSHFTRAFRRLTGLTPGQYGAGGVAVAHGVEAGV